MAIVWKLRAFLEDYRITPNALAEHVKGQISRTAIYNLVQAKPPSGVHFETMDVLLTALTELTGQTVQLADLLEHRQSSLEHESLRGSISLDLETVDNED